MSALPFDDERQYRLSRVQTFRWGTFDRRVDMPIARSGFLIIGASGSGKSTLLDATTALLVPARWADFNAAARQQGDRHDRNLVTYVRGAWGKQTDQESGESTKRFIRPNSTWSAISHTYKDCANGVVTLVAIFWIVGIGTASQDLKRAYLIFQRDFSFEELQAFREGTIDRRKLRSLFPDAFIEDEFSGYQARFQSLFGIESDVALKLLAKTQAAKDQEDISRFLRDFMLDPPKTFELADQAVAQFGELNEAHRAVLEARRQIDVLTPARDADIIRRQALEQRNILNEVELAIESYHQRRRATLLVEKLKSIDTEITGLEQTLLEAETRRRDEESAYEDLIRQQAGAGSNAAELERQISEEDSRKVGVMAKRDKAERACIVMGRGMPDNAVAFAELGAEASENLSSAAAGARDQEERLDELKRRRDRLAEQFQEVVKEIAAMKTQASNVPSRELDMRRAIAAGLGLQEYDLPFAAEVIDVRPEEQKRWRGAIERVLRGFGLSMLVRPEHYLRVSRYVNEHHLGWRLVYLQMKPQPDPKQLGPRSLPKKLVFKEGPFQSWVRSEVCNRFFHDCVDTAEELAGATHAVTERGQVKFGTRHEKDDREDVNKIERWVLGFENSARRRHYEERAAALGAEFAEVSGRIEALQSQRSQENERLMACRTIADLDWIDIDVGAVLTRIAKLHERLDAERKAHPELAELERSMKAQEKRRDQAKKKVSELEGELRFLTRDRKRFGEHLEDAQSRSSVELTPTQHTEWDRRFEREGRVVTLENLSEVHSAEARAIRLEIANLSEEINARQEKMIAAFVEFRTTWPAESEGLDASLESAEDFFAKLQRLEEDGLPRFETRFRTLLREQSDTNLTQLQSQLDQERSQIRRRLEEVNIGLHAAEFHPGTHIVIEVVDRNVEEVRQFRAQIRDAITPMRETSESDEDRFDRVKALIDRLRGKDPIDVQWRTIVLDVRQHVDFRAREIDQSNCEVEVYEGGSGKSGGQRQKLAATCLASALRYQLGGRRGGVPRFGTVFIDEAFSKSDAEFTAAAVAVFKRLGFQPILATPMARVMALEPFIGGAYYVDITDRRSSRGKLIEFLPDEGRLDIPRNERDRIAAEEIAATEAD